VLGGEQDNGSSLWRGTNGWQMAGPGDGGDNAFSPQHPDSNLLLSVPNLGIYRIKSGVRSGYYGDYVTDQQANGIDTSGALFIAPFAVCPGNENVVIAGAAALWRCDNMFSSATPQWSQNSAVLPAPGDQISAVAFAPSDNSGNTYVVGSETGAIYVTAAGGQNSWANADAGHLVPGRYVTAAAFHPSNPNLLYVTLSGFDEGTPGKPGHVFKTANALSTSPTWVNISPPVNLPHNAIVLDPANPNNIYVGTDIGVWATTDGGSTWSHLGPQTGMPNVAVFDLKIQSTSGRVFAFTHGRGAFMLDPNAIDNPPTITKFTPATAPVGTSINIEGTKFNNATAVQFAGVNAAGFTVNTSTQIVATVPPGASTGPISVTTPTGTAISAVSFTVSNTPAITAFTPASGNVGATVTITGESTRRDECEFRRCGRDGV
jgi:hypothetical protein